MNRRLRTRLGVLLLSAIAMPAVGFAQAIREIHAFPGIDEGTPAAPLLKASDGNLYGTTSKGGAFGLGSLFRVTPAGVRLTLASFTYGVGVYPLAGLIELPDGSLMGTASEGGAHDCGTIFRFTVANGLAAVASLDASTGRFPKAELVRAADGTLFGTAEQGGASNLGTVFKVTPSGVLSALVSFTGPNGSYPQAALALGSDASLFGTTQYGGSQDKGTVFKISPAGALSTLVSFDGGNGSLPFAPLLLAADGNFYGTTDTGGVSGSGTLFRMTPAGTLTTLVSFNSPSGFSQAGLIQGSDGALYGTTTGSGTPPGSVFRFTLTGSLTEFAFPSTAVVSQPASELVFGPDGALYGTALNRAVFTGGGGVFRIQPDLSGFAVITTFAVTSGVRPAGGIMQASDGNLYGKVRTNLLGDLPNPSSAAVFRLAPSGSLGSYRVFANFGLDLGGSADSALIQARDGKLYGTAWPTQVFSVTLAGAFTRLASFSSIYVPSALTQGPDDALYGANGTSTFRVTTAGSTSTSAPPGLEFGGFSDGGDGFLYGSTADGGSSGRGTIFRYPATIVASFGPNDGRYPTAPPIRDTDGTLYGTTLYGGPSDSGTFFSVSPSGVLKTLAYFLGSNGAYPGGPLLNGGDGFFYGTTPSGGSGGAGTLFRVTRAGVMTTLINFNGINGKTPVGPLIRARDGWIYGLASSGCSLGGGCVFRLEASVSPTALYFGATSKAGAAIQTGGQRVQVIKAGAASWSVTTSSPWLNVTPASGVGPASVVVTVNSSAPGIPAFATLTGQLVFTFADAETAAVDVTLNVRPSGQTFSPYGVVDTPAEGTIGLTGAIAITGWALDDVQVAAVNICREAVFAESAPIDGRCGNGEVFVGAATFVDGARPDVLTAFPTAPLASRGGWGLLVLSNVLPGGGNGGYTFPVYAVDVEGNSRSLLARRTISLDNAHATSPFGSIDTPGQGDTVSGVVTNFGWVLSPGIARADGAGGGTVDVMIDGVRVGSPSGWTSRSDLTSLFPASKYAGVNSALAVFTFDSRTYQDGVHTIAWSVVDNMGHPAGIGSRFLTIANSTSGLIAAPAPPAAAHASLNAASIRARVQARRGFDADTPLTTLEAGPDGIIRLAAEEVERIEIRLGGGAGQWRGHLEAQAGAAPLPVGSMLDPETGVFTWQPGAGFLGSYDLVFADAVTAGEQRVRITIYPKGSLRPRQVLAVSSR